MNQKDKRNAALYCQFRDEQFAFYDEYAKSQGILVNTFFVLSVLYDAEAGMTQKEICDAIHHSKQTVSQIINHLARDGYIAFREKTEDRRNKVITLTEAGRKYAEGPVTHITQAEERAMSMLAPKEQKELISLLERYTEYLRRLIKEEN